MKRKIAIILSVVFVIATAITVFAVSVDDPVGQNLIKKGYTEQDLAEINAISALSDEDILDYILQKYKALGDWQKVREAYNISETEYENYMKTQNEWQAILDRVPDEFMAAMKEEMSRQEIDYFINRANIMDIDFDYAWEQYQTGKTTEEIITEKKDAHNKQSETDTKYIMGEITTEEYIKSVAVITKGDEATIGKILSDVQTLRTEVRNRHKTQSGITDEEIAYCEAQGMTNPMDMFQAKYISKRNNISLSKVVASRLKNEDWISATAEVLNIPVDEYRQQVEQAKAQ